MIYIVVRNWSEVVLSWYWGHLLVRNWWEIGQTWSNMLISPGLLWRQSESRFLQTRVFSILFCPRFFGRWNPFWSPRLPVGEEWDVVLWMPVCRVNHLAQIVQKPTKEGILKRHAKVCSFFPTWPQSSSFSISCLTGSTIPTAPATFREPVMKSFWAEKEWNFDHFNCVQNILSIPIPSQGAWWLNFDSVQKQGRALSKLQLHSKWPCQ